MINQIWKKCSFKSETKVVESVLQELRVAQQFVDDYEKRRRIKLLLLQATYLVQGEKYINKCQIQYLGDLPLRHPAHFLFYQDKGLLGKTHKRSLLFYFHNSEIILEMYKTCFHSHHSQPQPQRKRPQTSISRTSKDVIEGETPLHRRIRRAFKMETMVYDNQWKRSCKSTAKPKPNIQSDQPEAVYSWLDQFQNSMSRQSIGTPFEYPATKYQQSMKLMDSKGYRQMKQIQRKQIVPVFAQEMRKQLRKIQQRKLQMTEESPHKNIQ